MAGSPSKRDEAIDELVDELIDIVEFEEEGKRAKASGPASAQRRVRRMKREKHLRHEWQRQKEREEEDARARELEAEAEKRKEEYEKLRKERREARQRQLEEQQQRRKKQLKEAEKNAAAKAGTGKSPPLHKRLEARDREEERKEEERRQQLLEERRKKFSTDEPYFSEAKRKATVDELLESLIVQLEAEHECWASQEALPGVKVSRFYERVVHEKEERRRREEEEKNARLERYYRGRKYGQRVRQEKLPQVSEEKRCELQRRLQESHQQRREPRPPPPSIREIFADRDPPKVTTPSSPLSQASFLFLFSLLGRQEHGERRVTDERLMGRRRAPVAKIMASGKNGQGLSTY